MLKDIIPSFVMLLKILVSTIMSNKLFIVFRITPRKFDTVQASEQFKGGIITSDIGDLTLSKRGLRTSFTFRKVRRVPCNCSKSLTSSVLQLNKASKKIHSDYQGLAFP